MIRYILLILIIFTSVLGFAQDYDDEDTSYYEPMFERDTLARVHVGMKAGTLMQGVILKTGSDPDFTDSIYSWNSEKRIGFLFGIAFDVRLSPHWNMATGMDFVISSIKMNINYDSSSFEENTNYSTLQIPAWFNYAPKLKPNRMHFGGGAIFAADISKRVERYGRLIQLKPINLMLGIGVGYRLQLPTKSNLNFDLQLHYGILNLVSDDNNFYNNGMDALNLWDITFTVSLN